MRPNGDLCVNRGVPKVRLDPGGERMRGGNASRGGDKSLLNTS